jgi:hypothetical protein
LQKFSFLSGHANQKNLHFGCDCPYGSNRGQIFIAVSAGVHQQDVRLFQEQIFGPERFGEVHSDHFNLPVLDQHPGKRFSQQSILSGDEDARLWHGAG